MSKSAWTAVVLAGGAACSLAFASAPQAATVTRTPAANRPHREQTIRLLETKTQAGGADVESGNGKIGDVFAFNSVLTDLQGRRVGRLDAVGTITGKGPGRDALVKIVTFSLAKGQITTQTTESPSLPSNGPEAITGGTGRYRGVGGELTFDEHGDQVQLVLHLSRP